MEDNNNGNQNIDNTLFNNHYDIYYDNNLLNNKYYNFENKPKYNIDLFKGVREELEKDKNSNNNIYLNFYNKHTKNKVLQDFTDLNKKYYDINMEKIKEKEYKFKIKKEEEEKLRKKKEKEDSNEYRKEQMLKLYTNQLNKYKKQLNSNNKYMNIKPKIYNSVRNNTNKNIISKSKPKIDLKPRQTKTKIEQIKKRDYSYKKKIGNKKSINNDYKIPINSKKNENHHKIIPKGNMILMTKKEYDKTIKDLKEKAKIYINELDKLKYNGKTIQAFERQIELGQLIDKIRRDIDKYQSKIGLKIIEN